MCPPFLKHCCVLFKLEPIKIWGEFTGYSFIAYETVIWIDDLSCTISSTFMSPIYLLKLRPGMHFQAAECNQLKSNSYQHSFLAKMHNSTLHWDGSVQFACTIWPLHKNFAHWWLLHYVLTVGNLCCAQVYLIHKVQYIWLVWLLSHLAYLKRLDKGTVCIWCDH